MPKIQFDVNVANGIAIDIANVVLLVDGRWRYTLFVLTNQNHCYMSKLNDIGITLSVNVTRPFCWFQIFLLCDLDLDFWPTFKKT